MITAGYFMEDARVFHSPKLIQAPQVSIILPTFYRGDSGLLARSIESVLSQTDSSFELIVMDDGSTDSTADVIAGYVRSDDRIIHVRHDTNCGLPALRVNEGLLMARGDLCAYQFDDDQWTHAFLETMTGALRENPDYEIAYSRCQCVVPGSEIMLGGPFDYRGLLTENFIANNSVLHRRSVFEELGGYDMHVVLRRLCDWDLWIRFARYKPFLPVDKVLTVMEARRPESIGNTCLADQFAMRAQMALDRNARLRPEALKSYVLDGLDHLRHLGENKVQSIWRQQVAPYLSRFRHIWPVIQPPGLRHVHVVVNKDWFDSTYEISIGSFAACLESDYRFTLLPGAETNEAVIRCAEILLLHRTTDGRAPELMDIAHRNGKCVVYLTDDDMLSLHELSEEFSWIAPGTARYAAVSKVIREADLVITYSRTMWESVQALNPRSILLTINIRRKWLAAAKSRLSQPGAGSGSGGPLRIGFAGGTARREEFAALWPAIVEASRQLGASAEFHFWGFQPEGLKELRSPFHLEPYTYNYDQYLRSLTAVGFDVMIAPLFAEKRAKRAKTPIKFLEIAAAGAVGIYSDVEPYRIVEDGVNGIKCDNTMEAWTAAILKAAAIPFAERNRMVAQAIQAVERDYIAENNAPRVGAALAAAVLQRALKRASSGKPRIAYFCHTPYVSGAGNQLLGFAGLAPEFQFEPLLVLPSGIGSQNEAMQQAAAALGIPVTYLPLVAEMEMDASRKLDEASVEQIARWLRTNGIGLAHSFLLMREVGEAARWVGIPHVASLQETYSRGRADVLHCDAVQSDSWFYADCWSEVLNTPAERILPFVGDDFFAVGEAVEGGLPSSGQPLIVGLFGSMQPRKGQLEAIEAVGLLQAQRGSGVDLRLFGYDHFDPAYNAACREMAERYGIQDRVRFAGFALDRAAEMSGIHVLLFAGNYESTPQVIPEAMAARRLVIAPRIGGIPELVTLNSGIPTADNSAASICQALAGVLKLPAREWREKGDHAREAVHRDCSRYSAAANLFRLYGQAAAARARTPKPEKAGVLDKPVDRPLSFRQRIVSNPR